MKLSGLTAQSLSPWHSENAQKKHESWSGQWLPGSTELADLLKLRFGASVNELLDAALLSPIKTLTDRPGKRIRAQLVTLGYELGAPASLRTPTGRRQCMNCANAIELVHAGSLIVDDIEDESSTRRGKPTLHCIYGVPIAVNAGNWLYFWPLELLGQSGLSADKELLLYQAYNRTLLRAHFGQALDVGLSVDQLEQEKVPGVVLSSLELKTGALAALGLVMGAIVGGAPAAVIDALDEFGHGFGVALQMFDDVGNLLSSPNPSKRFEDLALARPSWVWACAALHSTPPAYREFCTAVERLPLIESLEAWIASHNLALLARQGAHDHLSNIYQKLERDLENKNPDQMALNKIRDLGRQVSRAYG